MTPTMSHVSTKTIAIALLSTAALAGCFGDPQAAVGSTVVVDVTFYDLETGDLLGTAPGLRFVVGSNQSGLGREFESSLRGLDQGDEAESEVPGLPNATFDRDAAMPIPRDYLGGFPRNGTHPLDAVNQILGHEAEVGEEFDNRIYTIRVTDIDEERGVASLTYVLDGPQRDPFPELGITLVSSPRGDSVERTVDADVGTRFTIPATPPPWPFGLQPGNYEHVRQNATHFEVAPQADPAPVDFAPLISEHRVRVVAEVIEVIPPQGGPVDGNYGVRQSPQVLGDPEDRFRESLDGDQVTIQAVPDGHDGVTDDHTHAAGDEH